MEYASNDEYRVPVAVMQTAVTPSGFGGITDIAFEWDFADTGFPYNQFYANLYFSEFDALLPNQSRAVDIFLNGEIWQADYPPPYLVAGFVCSVMFFSFLFDAINAVKAQYEVKKQWTGDPCSPVECRWAGLNCSYISEPPSITAVNLSYSELTGEISPSFSELSAINYLDLSYNNLTGMIPDVLGKLSQLKVLFDNAPPSPPPSPNNKTIIIVISVIGGCFVLIMAVVFVWWCIWKRHPGSVPNPGKRHLEEKNSLYDTPHPPQPHPLTANPHIMRFSYTQLIGITNNFARKIGKGGFGVVLHGCLENGKQVAVKLNSQSSLQGERQFVAEVTN
ncbi:hypothetical protein ZIOFF_036013 [Zingiber officinale]|uniref:Malectin-like domain-containing protein n=1 Tax=Zingiber officinale TaxID=94328 RepID=A0A8J5GHH8_ZINOF|nr:hypothetical protein ZIOFF_036013 [Zingiber officinale]